MSTRSGQVRAVVREVYPAIEGGAFPIKRVVGESVNVWADVFSDGHDVVRAAVQFKHEKSKRWEEVQAEPIGNDRWHARFTVEKQGFYNYKVAGWVDQALTWQHGITKKIEAGNEVAVELMEGVVLLDQLGKIKDKDQKQFVKDCREAFSDANRVEEAHQLATSEKLKQVFYQNPIRPFIGFNPQDLQIYVDREKAAFSTWYEFFPRSSAKEPRHGTLADCLKQLPRVAELGFDTLYFPPVHPIGVTHRKGKNNTTTAGADDVGSCWGIGAEAGGHTTIHPDLGTIEDFKQVIDTAKELGIEIAMDYALQATPDHPWVTEHPDWFKQRPDGSIQYAENPPKKYQDIYPIHFETEDWKAMWQEFLDVLLFWIDLGIRVFRVDNPHTKPYGFWGWIIGEVKKKHPDVLFLSEAFSRPAVMWELSKQGFTQSYSYFTWRNNKAELIEYMTQLTQGPLSESFRPNFWPNTPDILPFSLQNASEHEYRTRYFLAATLSSNCGVYGPVYELMMHEGIPGKEEYLNSEKFEWGYWDWDQRNRITETYQIVNEARKRYRALQRTNNIRFLNIANDQLLAYLKTGDDGKKIIALVSLDGQHMQSGELEVSAYDLGLDGHQSFEVFDVISGSTFNWNGDRHFVQLGPDNPFHLLEVL